MVTRCNGTSFRLQADSSVSVAHATRLSPILARASQDMLQQYGGRQSVDVSRPVFGLAAQLPNCTASGGCRIPFVYKFNGHARTLFELRCDAPHFGCPRRVRTVPIQWKSQDERDSLELPGSLDDFGNWRTLSGAPGNESSGRRDYSEGVTDRQTDPPLSPVDGEYASGVLTHHVSRMLTHGE